MRPITIYIPDEHYEVLVQQAAKARRTPEDEAGVMVEECLSVQVDMNKRLAEGAAPQKAYGSRINNRI